MNFEKVPAKQAPCRSHSIQNFIAISPKLAEKVESGKKTPESSLCKAEVYSEGNFFEYLVDTDFLNTFVYEKISEGRKFHDRDKKNKMLNDRLIIKKMLSQMQWVCSKCFTELLIYDE